MLPIIFQDNYLIVIDKPAGLQVDRNRFDYPSVEETVHQYLREHFPWKKQLVTGLVHRLDRRVSGVVLIAKTRRALVDMNRQFEQRSVRKFYLAMVEKALPAESDELVHWLVKDSETRSAIVVEANVQNAKECRLRYQVLSSEDDCSLVEIELLTGRYHQIRAQLSAIGCPIIGDEKYGSNKRVGEGMICLHAVRLQVKHPKTGRELILASGRDVEHDWKQRLS